MNFLINIIENITSEIRIITYKHKIVNCIG